VERPDGHSDYGRFNASVFQSAKELLASEFPAGNVCLLLDVWMLGMSGIGLCRNIVASGRHLPTILTNGFDDKHIS
jgi:FixJ family two-component response regulator